MPTYSFIDTETGEEFEIFMKFSDREEFLKENPTVQVVMTAPAIVSGVSGSNKVPDGFKEVLSKVAEAHPNSSLGQKHARKNIKQAKTERIVKRYLDKVSKV